MLRVNVYHEGDVVRVCKQYSGGSKEIEMFQLVEGESCNVTVNAPLTCSGHKKVDGRLVDVASSIDIVPESEQQMHKVLSLFGDNVIRCDATLGPDLDVNSCDSVFMKGVRQAPEAGAKEILNWYRNLYYKEPEHTERGCLAWAINEVLQLVKAEEEENKDAKK